MLLESANQYIGLISEGSCDTQDWSDAEIQLSSQNKLQFKTYFVIYITNYILFTLF